MTLEHPLTWPKKSRFGLRKISPTSEKVVQLGKTIGLG